MPRTATKEPVTNVLETQSAGKIIDIRHMVRNLGPETFPEHNVWSFDDAERHIRETYLADGWEMLGQPMHVSTVKGSEQGGLRYDTIQLMYVFVKRDTA